MFLYIYYKCRNNHHDTYTVDKLQLNSTSNSNHNHRLVDFFSIVALIIFFFCFRSSIENAKRIKARVSKHNSIFDLSRVIVHSDDFFLHVDVIRLHFELEEANALLESDFV